MPRWRNWQGFVFNAGERVLGTTTPLLTMALGLIGTIVGADRIPLASNVLMMLAGASAENSVQRGAKFPPVQGRLSRRT